MRVIGTRLQRERTEKGTHYNNPLCSKTTEPGRDTFGNFATVQGTSPNELNFVDLSESLTMREHLWSRLPGQHTCRRMVGERDHLLHISAHKPLIGLL